MSAKTALPGVSSDVRYARSDIPMKIFSVIEARAPNPRSIVVSVMVRLLRRALADACVAALG